MIDLHVHTTASDGVLAPAALVARAQRAGITVLSITDHDTTAGLAEAREAAQRANIRLVNGIEITAVEADRDVHVLGYFFDPDDRRLAEFLIRQREDRVRRVHEIVERLAAAGSPIDARPIFAAAAVGGRSIGRPHIADALVAAGHARDRNDAFDRLLGANGRAFVPRRGPVATEIVAVIREAGGVASLAHPGLTRRDDLIPELARAGLVAIEARHADHDAETEARYRALAATYGLAVTGGSDFHAEGDHHVGTLGSVGLPPEDFAALEERLPASPKPRRREGVSTSPTPRHGEGGTPALEISGLRKNYAGLRPLRINDLRVAPGERVAISGLDAAAAELFINLVTGGALPDEGQIRVLGQPTADIVDGDAWIASLERFGIVSPRAVLLEEATVEQNLAMPFTLQIDPIPPDVVQRIAALAGESGLPAEQLRVQAATLQGVARARIHLARAAALEPKLLVLEHPTADVAEGARRTFAADAARVAEARQLAAVAITMDLDFAEGFAHRSLALDAATGALKPWKRKRGWF